MGTIQKEKKVFWADPNINNIENAEYKKDLESYNYLDVKCFNNIQDLINEIKNIEFEETVIIISGSFYPQFINIFKENIKILKIIPQIIIFTWGGRKEELKMDYEDIDTTNSFYHLGGVKTVFEDVKKLILKGFQKRDMEKEYQLTFEYIDCKEKLVLPTFYKALIDLPKKESIQKYNEYIYNKYSNNEIINKLLKPIKSIPDIPIDLLSKLYARLYTIDSDFYYDMNKDLRENKKDNYLTFIKILYEGVKLKGLDLAKENELYRGSKIANKEIEKIKEYLANKKKDLPGAIVFCQTFLSFTKSIEIAKGYLDDKNTDKDLSKVLYIIEKNNSIDYNLSTHADIEDLSIYKEKEKEVLFFPFSSFEITSIKEIEYKKENIYQIKLFYLGKYIKEIENIDEDIPNTKFKKNIEEKGLIPKEKMEKTREVIERFKEYDYFVNGKGDLSNDITLLYNNYDNLSEIKIFGEQFVANNKDKCVILFQNKEYELTEKFKFIPTGDIRLNGLEIKLRNIKAITDMSYMFHKCKSLKSLPDIFKWNTENITNMSYLFSECNLKKLPDISRWNTSNVINMCAMFQKCINIITLPDISRWNTSSVINMNFMFDGCIHLLELPDLSNWDTSKVNNMDFMFYECKSLISLPDISKWNIDNIINMRNIFGECKSELKIPLNFRRIKK